MGGVDGRTKSRAAAATTTMTWFRSHLTFFFSFLFFPSLEDQPTQKDLMDDTKRRRRVAIVSSKRSFWFLYYTSLCSAVQESCTCCSSWCNPGGPLPTNRSSMTWLNAHCSIDLRVCLPYNRPHNGHIHHQLQPKKKGGNKTSNLKGFFFRPFFCYRFRE